VPPDVVEDAPVRKFRSLNDLVWWMQNNGGGRVEITVSDGADDGAVSLVVLDGNGNFRSMGKGKFTKQAIESLD
jgi:hypothetical protein